MIQLFNGDCLEVMQDIPDNSIDLVVTSPPYDNLRDYNGYRLDLHKTGKELHRILKNGAVCCIVMQDQTKNFAKSLTSFRTILDWVDNIGFKLFETVIYKKNGISGAWWNQRFRVDHEYIFILFKGDKPNYFDKEHLKIATIHSGRKLKSGGNRKKDGNITKGYEKIVSETKCRGTIWDYTKVKKPIIKREHPATFPDEIPYDLIKCFTRENEIVLDPFVGSGTTMVQAKLLNRNSIGIDVSKEYIELCKIRLDEVSGHRIQEASKS
jgi:site-specific DNA-methyltransferase (adenine-specific)